MTMLLDDDDPTLCRAWVAGDEAAFAALVERYGGLIHARCRRALSPADAEDATQLVFLVLFRRARQAAASPRLAAWLLQVAHNVVRNIRRSHRRSKEIAVPVLEATATVDGSGAEIRAELDLVLAGLPKREREGIELHYLAGHTLAEVAAHQEVPLSTVASRIKRGLERLRRRLGAQGRLTAAGLVALLAAEAAEPLSDSMHARLEPLTLNDLPAPRSGLAPEAVAPPLALRLAMGAAAVVLAGVMVLGLGSGLIGGPVWAAEAAEPPAPPVPGEVENEEPGPQPARRFDHRTGQIVYVLQVHDPQRTLERLATAPEGALLPSGTLTAAQAKLAGIRGLRAAFDPLSIFSAEQRAILTEGADRWETLDPEEQADYQRRMNEALQDETAASGGRSPRDQMSIRLRLDHDPARTEAVRGLVDGALGDLFAGANDPVGIAPWQCEQSPGRLVLRNDCADSRYALAWFDATPPPARHPEAELEFQLWWRDWERGATEQIMDLHARLAPTGLELRVWSVLEDPAAGERLQVAVTEASLAALPAEALLGGSVALRPGLLGPLLKGVIAGLVAADPERIGLQPAEVVEGEAALADPGDAAAIAGEREIRVGLDPVHGVSASGDGFAARHRHLVLAATELLDRADGHLVLWLGEGVVLPSLNIALDCPEAPATALLAAVSAVSGQDPGPHGILQLPAPSGLVQLAWQDGRLLASSDPRGLDVFSLPGGFTTHADVGEALDRMAGDRLGKLVLRSAPLLEAIQPLMALQLPPQEQERLQAFVTATRTAGRASHLSFGAASGSWELEAQGLVAGIAGLVLGVQGMQALSGSN